MAKGFAFCAGQASVDRMWRSNARMHISSSLVSSPGQLQLLTSIHVMLLMDRIQSPEWGTKFAKLDLIVNIRGGSNRKNYGARSKTRTMNSYPGLPHWSKHAIEPMTDHLGASQPRHLRCPTAKGLWDGPGKVGVKLGISALTALGVAETYLVETFNRRAVHWHCRVRAIATQLIRTRDNLAAPNGFAPRWYCARLPIWPAILVGLFLITLMAGRSL